MPPGSGWRGRVLVARPPAPPPKPCSATCIRRGAARHATRLAKDGYARAAAVAVMGLSLIHI
eukprot:10803796-Alexandrium_andersonii.AAC.1